MGLSIIPSLQYVCHIRSGCCTCGHIILQVTNFTSSFSDGRVFCYLLHHYHPHLLPLEAINNDTSLTAVSQLAVEEDNDDVDDGLDNQWAKNFSPSKFTSNLSVWLFSYIKTFNTFMY